jgi:2-dehydro-3-deoxygalactonokinase
MPMPSQFLSCDWGTSSFRLRLVSSFTKHVFGEVRAPIGVKQVFEKRRANWPPVDPFAEVMTEQLEALADKADIQCAPLVISGMASSTIGWKELPYAELPFSLDGAGLRVEEFEWDNPCNIGPTFLISGAATDSDVMRGEECQAIGILAEPELAEFRQCSLLILPGTHSKHILIDNGKITGFHTYMTRELFDTLAGHTVLSPTIEVTKEHSVDDFRAGVKLVRKNGLAASLFRVRSRSVLDRVKAAKNASFLSGILIGSETTDLSRYENRPTIVAAKKDLLDLYRLAMPRRSGDHFTSEIDRATTTAHRLVLTRLYS